MTSLEMSNPWLFHFMTRNVSNVINNHGSSQGNLSTTYHFNPLCKYLLLYGSEQKFMDIAFLACGGTIPPVCKGASRNVIIKCSLSNGYIWLFVRLCARCNKNSEHQLHSLSLHEICEIRLSRDESGEFRMRFSHGWAKMQVGQLW